MNEKQKKLSEWAHRCIGFSIGLLIVKAATEPGYITVLAVFTLVVAAFLLVYGTSEDIYG